MKRGRCGFGLGFLEYSKSLWDLTAQRQANQAAPVWGCFSVLELGCVLAGEGWVWRKDRFRPESLFFAHYEMPDEQAGEL